MISNIQDKIDKLPFKPGVYLMKDEKSNIIYVGKARSLKKRVRQYFQSYKTKSTKTKVMVKNIRDFEYIITDNEIEALILEANLIKKHKPKYNILLRDDKRYPYIKITVNEKYPRVIKTRKIQKDGAKYFGPYTSSGAVNDTLQIIRNLYPIRTCKSKLNGQKIKDRPCLNHFIDKCLAPCQGNVDKDEYMDLINDIIMFLSGKEEKLIDIIEEKMKKASKNLDFENAAKYRDQKLSLEHILQKQKVVSTNIIDQDIIGMARGIDQVCIQVFFVRAGKMQGREHFILTDTDGKERNEILSSFIKQFYLGASYVPKEVLIEKDFDDREIISYWLSDKRGSKVYIKVPKIGDKNKLMNMVKKNALEIINNSNNFKGKRNKSKEALKELKELLNLDVLPNRIEAFDISNIQGVESVGSMIVFEKGERKPSDYRRFKIKSIHGPNDYASMEEIISRRFNRGIKEKEMLKKNKIGIESFSLFPDILMVDGGKGHVNVAKSVLKKLNLDILVCGLVKDDFHRTRGIIYNNEELNIKKNSKLFRLITKIQDEAHRFAINYHRSLRNKKVFKSVLDDIKGVGKVRKKLLLKEFGSIDKIRKASIKELNNVKGMNKRVAKFVYEFFNGIKK